jgi:hypothetical protein
MYQTELIYFVVLTILIVVPQFLPTELLLVLDHLIVRIAVIFALLYLVNKGPTAAIFGFMAIASLYLERNRRKVKIAANKLDAMDVNFLRQATVEEASTPQKTVPVKPFDQPKQEESTYVPEDLTCDITNFEPVAPTINQKAVLSSIYPLHDNGQATASDSLYEKMGFGHVEGNEI